MNEIEAIYCFEDHRDNEFKRYFKVIEHGHPIGAACYFWYMRRYQKCIYTDHLASAFIKANADEVEEISANKWEENSANPRALFRYCICSDGNVTVEKLIDEKESGYYKVFFIGHYAELINQYDDFLLDHVRGYEQFYSISSAARKATNESYMTLLELKAEISRLADCLLRRECLTDEIKLIDLIAEYRQISELEKD